MVAVAGGSRYKVHCSRLRLRMPPSPPTMSKFTLAIVAGASAAVGAATTAALYGIGGRRGQETQTIATTTTTVSRDPSRTTPPPPTPIRIDDPKLPAIPPVDPSGVFQYGFPGPVADLRAAPSLTSSFDRARRNPHWGSRAHHACLPANEQRRPQTLPLRRRPLDPAQFRAKLSDYLRSGFDRGHQVPAADAKWSQEAMNSTFALSNMCPQVGMASTATTGRTLRISADV